MPYYADQFAKRQPMSDRMRANPYADALAQKRQKDQEMWASMMPGLGAGLGIAGGAALGFVPGVGEAIGGPVGGAALGGKVGGAFGQMGQAGMNANAQQETDPQRLREMQRAALMQALAQYR